MPAPAPSSIEEAPVPPPPNSFTPADTVQVHLTSSTTNSYLTTYVGLLFNDLLFVPISSPPKYPHLYNVSVLYRTSTVNMVSPGPPRYRTMTLAAAAWDGITKNTTPQSEDTRDVLTTISSHRRRMMTTESVWPTTYVQEETHWACYLQGACLGP